MKLRIVTYKDKFKIEYKSWFFGWLTLSESVEIIDKHGLTPSNYYNGVTYPNG